MRPFLPLLLATTPVIAKDPVFVEKGGIIAIEAESTSSPLGSWIKKTDVADFSGDCHLEFTGNKISNGPPNSPLKYHFRVKKSGNYQLTIRARKRLENERKDLSNDCYVSLKGDFQEGGGAPLKTLKTDTKMFGGDADKWGWTTQLDFDHKKAPAIYKLKEGEDYELTISGRSKNFNFDRFLLIHETENLRKTRQANPQESQSDDTPIPAKELTTRTLTDTQGRVLKVQLEKLVGDTLMTKIKGKRVEIKLETLSEEDQSFIRKWATDQE